MRQAVFAQFSGIGIDASNLLEARMVITPYNQHVRLLSSEPFGWFAPPKFTRTWEPTLFMESFHCLWNHYTHLPERDPMRRAKRTTRANKIHSRPLVSTSQILKARTIPADGAMPL